MSSAASYEGRGGQQLLIPRLPFCPGRDCLRRCGAADCTCKPCRMACCQRRARRTPDLIRAFEAQPIVQSPLFSTRSLA